MRHGGRILVDQMVALGVERVFTVPGESFLPVLDALFDTPSIATIVCRHESGAAMMAEATGKLRGRPGVAIVTRGPGAANAMSGIHIAGQDQTPMLLLVGLHAGGEEDRECFQEIDLRGLFGSMAKWTAVVRSPERLPEILTRAYHLTMSGRPGPVVLGLPEDVLSGTAVIADAMAPTPVAVPPSPDALAAIGQMLDRAERPLVIAGGPGWSEAAAQDLSRFATAFQLPVATAFRRQDAIDNRHPCYVGHLGLAVEAKLAAAVRGADLVIAIATRLDDVTTGADRLIATPDPSQRLVHIHPAPDQIGRLHRTQLPIVADAQSALAALAALPAPTVAPAWATFRRDLRAAYEATLEPMATPGAVKLEQIVAIASRCLPEDAIVTNGAGNYAAFLHRYFVYKRFHTQLAPGSGSMGYGLPAAIAAKLANPTAPVVAFAGDGCLTMSLGEVATAVQYGLPIVVVVANNAMYGTIRMHQERQFPGRVIATTLVNPDFAALARSFGARGVRIEHTEAFEPALLEALQQSRPTLIELILDPQALTPRATLAAIRSGQG